MGFDKIEMLLDKYFQGTTSIDEERELNSYFSSGNVEPHLEKYKGIFVFFDQSKQQKYTKKIPKFTKKHKVMWFSIAASIAALLSFIVFLFINHNNISNQDQLGTYTSPERAFEETQKALALLSIHVSAGIKSVNYVQEYENTKNKVFKKTSN
jgi:hypothetical protein